MDVLKAEGLVKKYGRRTVVKGININVKTGEVVALLGPNGAGKTTTFYMIMGAIRPNKGKVFFNDKEITRLPMYKRARLGIGYLPQESSIFRNLSVWDNVYSVLEMRKMKKAERIEKTKKLLEMLNVLRLKDSKGYQLSGGERRRVEIARALALDPKFLLLDEPFTGIDPKTREEIQDIIIQLKNIGIGILITDHNVRETLEITDRAYIIYDGEILIEGTSKELIENPKVRELYIGWRFKI
jgi:lipopolysaccharide export system ATP-binding protein